MRALKLVCQVSNSIHGPYPQAPSRHPTFKCHHFGSRDLIILIQGAWNHLNHDFHDY